MEVGANKVGKFSVLTFNPNQYLLPTGCTQTLI